MESIEDLASKEVARFSDEATSVMPMSGGWSQIGRHSSLFRCWVYTSRATCSFHLDECDPPCCQSASIVYPCNVLDHAYCRELPYGIAHSSTRSSIQRGQDHIKEYVEQTIARMHAPPQEPLAKRSRTTMLGIPMQTHSFATLDGALVAHIHLAGTSLEVIVPSAPARPSELKIGGLKLEMP